MFSAKMFKQSFAAGVLLIALVCSLLVVSPANATYHQILSENWERDIGTDFPWITWNHPWGIYPDPPSQTNPRWDVERNAIYHGLPPNITSVWCVGSNDQLTAGESYYTANVYTHLYWGPFSIADAANEHGSAFGSIWLWAQNQAYSGGNGDFFYLGVRAGGFTPSLAAWDYLYKNNIGGTGSQWTLISFDFDEVETADGQTISYLDEGIHNNLYISLIFKSNATDNDYLGVFVDDVSLGYDDGMYDFDYRGYELFNPDDPEEELTALYVNTPAQMRVKFKSHGSFLSNEVDHVLYNGQNQVVSQITGQWEGGIIPNSYTENFPLIFTPQEIGELAFTIFLDGNSEQTESDEMNNYETFTLQVLGENTAPEIEWINPPAGGIEFHDDVFEIIYNATNSPVEEPARISFYYDYDNQGYDGYSIPGGTNLTVMNDLDTLQWYIGALPDLDYYIYAKLQDDYHEAVYSYSDAILEVEEASSTIIPDGFQITSVYPNPFNPTVEIAMELPGPGDVRATWYSVDGRQVDVQKLGALNAGQHRFTWTPQNLPSGVYLLRLETPFGQAMEKVTYLK